VSYPVPHSQGCVRGPQKLLWSLPGLSGGEQHLTQDRTYNSQTSSPKHSPRPAPGSQSGSTNLPGAVLSSAWAHTWRSTWSGAHPVRWSHSSSPAGGGRLGQAEVGLSPKPMQAGFSPASPLAGPAVAARTLLLQPHSVIGTSVCQSQEQ
jgi:hypothetical protein